MYILLDLWNFVHCDRDCRYKELVDRTDKPDKEYYLEPIILELESIQPHILWLWPFITISGTVFQNGLLKDEVFF